ncbi:MFS transporter [Mucisphaera sp.]|uniref:MFS transporter n=1 Tax=Mucisphaera sp. TaxID=2913024 RepID=UPI003D0B18CE
MSDTTTLQRVHKALTSEDDGRTCRDIPDSACREQPANFLTHVTALAMTKTGDGLLDPKLVLAWLLTALGSPAAIVGLLVPVREAGALLPQLITAGYIRAMKQRKWAWVAGSAVQGLAVLAIAATALTLQGGAAGVTIIALLALFALGRSVCSVSYKDVLGKTVAKATRGTATGSAGTLAASAVLLFGILLALDLLPRTTTTIAIVLTFAAGLWLTAAALMSTLTEEPGETEGGNNALLTARDNLKLLYTDCHLRRFIATRALLTATALAPPYILALAGSNAPDDARLGFFIIASSLAALTTNYIWGRLADRSSRRVLILAAIIATISLLATATLGLYAQDAPWLAYALPASLFLLMIAYQGVRLGRSVHLVDMATPDTRAAYTALSNTTIGLLLLAASAFAGLTQTLGVPATLLAFATMTTLATITAATLDEVQQDNQ